MTARTIKLGQWLFAVARPSDAGAAHDIWAITFRHQQEPDQVLGHVLIDHRSGLAHCVMPRAMITFTVCAIAKFMRRQEAKYARRRAAASAVEALVR